MSYHCTTLENGLRVASDCLPAAETVAVAISVDVGARYESEAQHGISHLLEHMAFKGTDKRNAREIAEAFDAIGGQLNAYTSHEHTVYHARALKDDLPLMIDILCDIIQHSVFDDEELAREKQVILQELAMHHDTPDDLIFDYFQDTAFQGQPLGRSILGTPEHVTAHSPEDLRRFTRSHYLPSRMVLSAAGNLEHEALLSLVNAHFTQADAMAGPVEQARYIGGTSVREKTSLEQVQLMVGFPCPPVHSDDYYAVQLLAVLLGGGMSSRLFQEIREKRGLVYSISSFASAYNDTGIFSIYAATGEHEVRELIPALCDELLGVCNDISQEELDRARKQQKAGLMMMRENTASVAEWIGRHLLVFGEYRTASDLAARFDAITKDDILRIAQTMFTGTHPTLAALGPTGQLEGYEDITACLMAPAAEATSLPA